MALIVSLDSAADPRLDDYHGVSDPALARRKGFFVAEGRLVVARLLETRPSAVQSVLVSPAARDAMVGPLARLDPGVPVYVLPRMAFASVTGVHIHRGCLALAARPAVPPLQHLVSAASLLVVLETVGNADNVGGIFRNAAAFGADAILLGPGCCDPLYRKAIRTSMGAALVTPFGPLEPWPEGLETLRTAGFTIAALTPRHPSVALDAFAASPRPARLALVCGTEGAGLSDEAAGRADVRIRIPTTGRVDSLNVAVAVGIALSRIAAPTDG